MAKVTLSRKNHCIGDKLGKYKIFVDDARVESLGWFRPEVTFDVLPGKHYIYVRLDRWRKQHP